MLRQLRWGRSLAAAAGAPWGSASVWGTASPGSPACAMSSAAAAPVNKMALIKELREKSSAPMSDVKACLEACQWDVSAAYDALRRKGIAAAAKKASRHAAEGLVGLAQVDPTAVAIAEVNSETDFVARNERFTRLVSAAATAALAVPGTSVGADLAVPFEQLADVPVAEAGGTPLGRWCTEVAAVVRENIQLRRGYALRSRGVVGGYVHQPAAPGVGRIVAAVALEGPDGPIDPELLPAASQLARELAMHVAGMRPMYLDRGSVPPAVLEHEAALLREQAAGAGKADAVVARVVEGRLAKWAEDTCLLQQRFVLDGSKRVQQVVAELGKQAGVALAVTGFVRVQVGEGLDTGAQGAKDFAAEVAAMTAATG